MDDALRLKAEHESRMNALDAFLADYEAKHGAITDREIDDAVRRARGRATVGALVGRWRINVPPWRAVTLVLDAGAFLAVGCGSRARGQKHGSRRPRRPGA